MAKAFAADGVTVVACTPHILPGLYHNSGPQIRQATARLQQMIKERGIPLQLVTGADNHVVPDFLAELRVGQAIVIGRYTLRPGRATPSCCAPSPRGAVFQLHRGAIRANSHPSGAADLDFTRITRP